jgi:hypothetical protein
MPSHGTPSTKTPSTRTPEKQTRRYVKKAKHFWLIVKKEPRSFSLFFTFSLLFLFSGARCSIHRGFYSQRQDLHASISPAQRCHQTVSNEWHIPMGKPQSEVTKRIVHRHKVMMNKGQLQPCAHS